MAMKAREVDALPIMPSGAFGDHTSAMALAGGVATALFHRERTGEARVVDVSLLGMAMWSFGAGVTVSAISDAAAQSRPGTRCPNNGYFEGRWYCNVYWKTLGNDWRQQIRQIRAAAGMPARSP